MSIFTELPLRSFFGKTQRSPGPIGGCDWGYAAVQHRYTMCLSELLREEAACGWQQ